VVYRCIEIPGADAFREGVGFEIGHEGKQAGLGGLRCHS
jgi:hypothetical protein